MLLSTLPAQHALAPVEIDASVPALSARRRTVLRVRRASLNVLEGRRVSVSGTLSPGVAGRRVSLQVSAARGWHTLVAARTRLGGAFRLRYRAQQAGSRRVRILFGGDAAGSAAHRRLGRLNVFRPSEASWYGGGGTMACGGSLTSTTLGVANKTLPCGALVTLRYDGRSIRVPVVDRGPYVAGREYDLTPATKQALGFGDTGEIWATR